MFKRILAGFLMLGIIFFSFMYTYSDRNLPFRQRAFVIQNANGEEMYFSDMCKNKVKYNDSLIDINAKWRQEGITVTGTIVVDKVKEEKGDYKIISKDCYCQVGRNRMSSFFINTKDAIHSTTIVVYFKGDKTKIKELVNGDKLSFKANFNTLNKDYFILTEGEIV